ncbi:uncharacterized mitochondrial protein AtMg00810-like [Miscanthus floridulus]|uniref:uncharacterized mitochondrial protein AtMg00810-like n=1 Tax=Miscanthus floridulus TaxID=154761 RepID=UPI00345ADEB9
MYVDDLIITGARAEDIDSFKHEMVVCFRMSDLSALSYYLSIEVRQGKEALTLDQSAYTSKLLEQSGMAECKSCVTPMEERLKLTKTSTTAKVDATLYRSIIGGLRYLVHMRPDIAFAVGNVVAVSTCEAEYVAAATAACQAVWLRRLLGELTSVEAHPPALMVDNQPAIALAKNLVLHHRSKHIDGKFHFLRDCVAGGKIVIEFVETSR